MDSVITRNNPEITKRTGITGNNLEIPVLSVISGIPLIFPLQLRVIPGSRNHCFFTVNFRHPEFRESGITRKTELRKKICYALP